MSQHFSPADVIAIRVFASFAVLGAIYLYLEHRWSRRRYMRFNRRHVHREIGFKACKPNEDLK